jgi:hypothetical protein
MVNPLLTDNNLKNFIESLKLSEEQKKFLLDELPKMDVEERLELLNTLKDVYLLNEEEKEALIKLKDNWQK